MLRHPDAKDAAIINVRFDWLDRLRILFHGRCSVRAETADVLNILSSGVTVPRVFYWPWRRRGFIHAGDITVKAPRVTLPAALIFCALTLFAGTARADMGGLASPAAPDAGALDVPVQLKAGVPAPFDGWELSEARIQVLVNGQGQALPPAPKPAQSSSSTVSDCLGGVLLAAAVVFVGGVVAGYELAKR